MSERDVKVDFKMGRGDWPTPPQTFAAKVVAADKVKGKELKALAARVEELDARLRRIAELAHPAHAQYFTGKWYKDCDCDTCNRFRAIARLARGEES